MNQGHNCTPQTTNDLSMNNTWFENEQRKALYGCIYSEKESVQQNTTLDLFVPLCFSQDEEYWNMFGGVIDEKKERLWDALINGFEQYSNTLTERAKLIQTTDALRQQVSVYLWLLWSSRVTFWLIVEAKVLKLKRYQN